MEVVVAPVLHKYVPPPDAVRSTVGDAHVIVAVGGVIAVLGGVVFWLMTELDVAVQAVEVICCGYSIGIS